MPLVVLRASCFETVCLVQRFDPVFFIPTARSRTPFEFLGVGSQCSASQQSLVAQSVRFEHSNNASCAYATALCLSSWVVSNQSDLFGGSTQRIAPKQPATIRSELNLKSLVLGCPLTSCF